MRIHFFILVLFICSTSSFLHAQTHFGPLKIVHSRIDEGETLSVVGPVNFKDVHVDSVRIMGPLIFEKLTVKNTAQIIGPCTGHHGHFDMLDVVGDLKGQEIECGTLNIIGPVDCLNLKAQKIYAVGPLKIDHGAIDECVVTSDRIILDSVHVGSILIKKDHDKTQILVLQGATCIKKDVHFESGRGIVQIARSAHIEGVVRGGVIQKL